VLGGSKASNTEESRALRFWILHKCNCSCCSRQTDCTQRVTEHPMGAAVGGGGGGGGGGGPLRRGWLCVCGPPPHSHGYVLCLAPAQRLRTARNRPRGGLWRPPPPCAPKYPDFTGPVVPPALIRPHPYPPQGYRHTAVLALAQAKQTSYDLRQSRGRQACQARLPGPRQLPRPGRERGTHSWSPTEKWATQPIQGAR